MKLIQFKQKFLLKLSRVFVFFLIVNPLFSQIQEEYLKNKEWVTVEVFDIENEIINENVVSISHYLNLEKFGELKLSFSDSILLIHSRWKKFIRKGEANFCTDNFLWFIPSFSCSSISSSNYWPALSCTTFFEIFYLKPDIMITSFLGRTYVLVPKEQVKNYNPEFFKNLHPDNECYFLYSVLKEYYTKNNIPVIFRGWGMPNIN